MHATARRAALLGREQHLQQRVDPRGGGRVVGGAHERDDVAIGLLEQADEQLHADESGGAGQQHRAVFVRPSSHGERHSWMFLAGRTGLSGVESVAERGHQARAGRRRRDDLVDHALRGGGRRRQVLGGVAVGEAVARPRRVVGRGDLAAVDEVDGLLGTHDAELRARPGEHEVGAELAAVHRDERAAEGLAQHDGHARHRRGGERVHELGAVADDPAGLLLEARQEARRVDEHDERQPERVARVHEARRLAGGLGVQRAAEELRLVGDDADRAPVDARVRGDDVARPARVELEHAAAVDERAHRRRARRRPCAASSGTRGSAPERLDGRPARGRRAACWGR